MTVEGWFLMILVVMVGYCGNRLAEIAAAAEDIQERLKRVYPISQRERDELHRGAEFRSL